jgi:hypothetical protein
MTSIPSRRAIPMAAAAAFACVTALAPTGRAQAAALAPATGPLLEAAALPTGRAGSLRFIDARAGATPFIAFARFRGSALSQVASVSFRIKPRAGATAAPVQVTASAASLRARGHVTPDGTLELPVVGLYAGEANVVSVAFTMRDGTVHRQQVQVTTAAYVDPNHIYDQPTRLVPRDPGVSLGYSYIYLKSALGSPVVIDVDGALRWVGPAVPSSFSSTYADGIFVIGDANSTRVHQMGLDGQVTDAVVDLANTESFNHNITPGRDALLAGVNMQGDGVIESMSTIIEMTPDGHVIRSWDFQKIIGDWMTRHGDDAAAFVRPGKNWLHLNAQVYDPRDNSLVVSSREQFVMKVDYDTGAIKWLFGDPKKYWHTFASLRALALDGPADTFWPIGQHSITLRDDGTFMVFNNGAPTCDQPKGEPPGQTRPYSAVTAYRVDEAARTVRSTWGWDHAQTLKSAVCSSAWEVHDGSKLVNFAAADNVSHMHLVGLDANARTAFEYQYATKSCSTGWHAIPFSFEALTIQ